MRGVPLLIAGTLFTASAAALAASPATPVVELRETAGPIEQQARSVAPGNQLPKRKSVEVPEYPWQLRRIGARAALIVQVTVDVSGRVVELRRSQGPLLQPAIGSPTDDAAEKAAADAVMRSAATALSDWRFDRPEMGPITFQISIGFVGGQVNSALTDPSELLPKQAPAAPWAAANGALPTGAAIKPPKKTKYVKPVYPKAALDARVQGEVVLEVVVGPNGRVTDTRVIRSVPKLDQAAIDATMQAQYEPVHINGIPVSVTTMVTHTFSFKTKSE